MVRHASDVGHASLGGVSVLATPSGRAQAASFAPVMRDCSTPRMRPSVRDSHALPRVNVSSCIMTFKDSSPSAVRRDSVPTPSEGMIGRPPSTGARSHSGCVSFPDSSVSVEDSLPVKKTTSTQTPTLSKPFLSLQAGLMISVRPSRSTQ